MKQSAIYTTVKWKDLVKLSPVERLIENTVTLPWLIASLLLAYHGHYLWAIPCSVLFFLTALRQVHNGFHQSLGLSRKVTWFSLYVNSLLMLVSAHAVQFSHLRHHKYCLGEEDHEGKCARMKWWQAILYGPVHIYTIHKVALQSGNRRYRRDVIIEMASIGAFVAAGILFELNFLLYHFIVMTIGEFFSAFFAVWTVHHDTDDKVIARTQRGRWKNFITYNMFYHLEHHLFPAVPTIKLPELARRIDESFPEMEKKKTF